MTAAAAPARARGLRALCAALMLLCLCADRAAAQGMSWWLGTPSEDGGTAPPAARAPAGAMSWWLGATEGPDAPVPPSQTLGWWFGSSAQADDPGEDAALPGIGEAPDYLAWEALRAEVEAAIEDPGTTNLTLEQLRSRIAAWRERLLSAQSANSARIATIRSQITALGPAPAEGETEPAEIAARRQALNEQLGRLQAPGIAAEEAYLGADGLIREIDGLLRGRQANELLELGPSPLVPLNWPPALAAVGQLAAGIAGEARAAWASESLRANARESLPATLLFAAIGLALLLRGRTWSERLSQRLLAGGGRRAKRVVLALLVSLGQVVVPFLGVVLLVTGAFSTGLVGQQVAALLGALPMLAIVILAARWLGHQVFARADETALLRELAPERRTEGRFYASALGILLALAGLVAATVPHAGATLVARVVLDFPILVLGGLILLRLGQILVSAGRGIAERPDLSTRATLLVMIGRAAIGIAIAGPLMAAIGYYTLGRFLVFPAALSLGLLALVIILQRLTADLYALATGRGDDEEEALVPVLIGFALALGAVPLLALIWGARSSDLTELWARAREGFAIGETRIAPADFVTFAAVFVILYLATRLVQGALRTSVLPKTRMDPGGQNAIVSGVGYVGVILAAILAVTSAGIDLSSLAIVAGALSVGIGFGLQNIVSNFISGIILLVERPISEGDWIEVNGQQGYVRDISVRSTRIETFDRTDVIVPNSDLIAGVVTNFTHGNLTGRIIVKVGVAYGSDTRKIEAILREIAEAHPLVSLNPKPAVIFMGFGADALDFEIRAILRDVNFSLSTRSEINHEIARRFAEEGVEIPFAQRDIWLRNPEALAAAAGVPVPEPAAAATAAATAAAANGPARRGGRRKAGGAKVDPALQDPAEVPDLQS